MGATSSAIRAGRAFVELFADDTKLQAVLNRTRISLTNLGGWLRSVGLKMLALGPALTVPIVAGLKRYADFELQMKKVAAVTRVGAVDFRKLSEEARRLGRETVFTSAEAASAMFVLSKQGFTTAREITAVVGPALDLAAAAELDLAEAVRITTGILKSQRFPVNEPRKLAHAIDMLTEAFHSSNMADIRELGDAMKYVGPVTEQLKVPLEQVIASIQALSDANIRGEMAGTTLRGSLLSLIAPSEKAARVLQRLRLVGPGFNKLVDQATGGLRPLHDIIGEFQTAFGRLGLSAAGQQSLLAQLFDDRQASGFARLVSVGSEELQRMAEHLNGAAGRAAQLRDVKFTALKGQFEILTGAIDELAIAIGEHLAPHAMRLIQWSIKAVETLSDFAKVNGTLVVEFVKTNAAIAATGGLLFGLGSAAQLAAFSMGGIGRAIRLALSPAQLLSDALTGVLRLMAKGERLGRSWAGFLSQTVLGGSRTRRRSTPADKVAKAAVKSVSEGGSSIVSGAGQLWSGMRRRIAPPAMTADVRGAVAAVGPAVGQSVTRARQILATSRTPLVTVRNVAAAYRRFEASLGLRAGALVRSVRELTERESNGAEFGTRTGGMLGRIRGVFWRGAKQVGLTPGEATSDTAKHELGHAVDTNLGGGTYASRDNVGLPGRLRESLSRLLPRRRMRRMTSQYRNYFADPAEQFARFFAGRSAPMQRALASRESNRSLLSQVRGLGRSLTLRGMRGLVHLGRGFDVVERSLVNTGQFLARHGLRGRRRLFVGVGRAAQLPVRLFQHSYRGAMAGMAGSKTVARGLSLGIAALPTKFLAHGIKALDFSLKAVAGGFATVATAAKLGRAALTVGWSAGFSLLRVGFRGAVVGIGAVVSNTPKLWQMAKGFTAMSVGALKASTGLIKLATVKGWSALIGSLTRLLSPGGLLVGGLVVAGFAIAANWQRITGALSAAGQALPGALSGVWQRIKADAGPTFTGIWNSATKAFGGISEALQAGDIPAAAQILWVSLKGIWDQGIGYLSILWTDLKAATNDAWLGIQQLVTQYAAGIAGAVDLALFDWFGIRLADVTGAFASAWDWIKGATASLMDWSRSAWESMFGNVGKSAESFTDYVWNSFEWIRKKLAQILLMATKVASIGSKVATLGFGGFEFNMQDAMEALDQQFAQRSKDRQLVKAGIADGTDPAQKARQDAAAARMKELEAQRKENEARAKKERAEKEQAQDKVLFDAQAELDLAIQNTREARAKREEAEKDAQAKRDAAAAAAAELKTRQQQQRRAPPQGSTPAQARAWFRNEAIRERKAAAAALKERKAQTTAKLKLNELAVQAEQDYRREFHAGRLSAEDYEFHTGRKAPKKVAKPKTFEQRQQEALDTWGIDWDKKERDAAEHEQRAVDVEVPDLAAIALKLAERMPDLTGLNERARAGQQASRDERVQQGGDDQIVAAIAESNRSLQVLIGVTRNVARYTT